MHMADALLSPAVGAAMWAVTAGALAASARSVRKAGEDRVVPLMGVLGAFVFAAQMITFAIPATGSSGHIGGGLLLSILLGPAAAFVVIASVLTVLATALGLIFAYLVSSSVTRPVHRLLVIDNRVTIDFGVAKVGSYTFASLANFLANRFINYTQSLGDSGQFQSNPNYAGFLQDEWRVRPNLTFNLGIRYEIELLPEGINRDPNNFAPRFGFAYSPGSDGNTAIRANYGVFYDRILLRATSNGLLRDGEKFRAAVVSFGLPEAPVFPNQLANYPEGILTSRNSFAPNMASPYTQQGTLEIERALTKQFGHQRQLSHGSRN